MRRTSSKCMFETKRVPALNDGFVTKWPITLDNEPQQYLTIYVEYTWETKLREL